MQEQMPMFDDIPTPAADAPKKPRKKPVRRQVAAAPKPVKRRKKRVAKAKPAENHISKDVYKAVNLLLDMPTDERELVLEVVRGLSK